MKLKIESDGTTVGTQVTDIETGKRVGMIQKITWEVSVDDPVATCTIVIAKMPLLATASVKNQKVVDVTEAVDDK